MLSSFGQLAGQGEHCLDIASDLHMACIQPQYDGAAQCI